MNTTKSALSAALSGGGRFVKWESVGDAYGGPVESVEVRQARKFGTDTPDMWDDGSPKLQVAVTVTTEDRTDADDDGRRTIVVNLWGSQRRALVAACRVAGVEEPAAGMTFTARWVSGAGGASDPRVYEYVLTPAASPVAAALAVDSPPAAAAPAGNPAEIAASLRRNGMDPALIAASTGLPVAVVEAMPAF